MSVKITLLPGDGIGTEIMDAAIRVLDRVASKFDMSVEYDKKLIGGISFDTYGSPLTDETLEACFQSDVVLLGAVGGPKWEGLAHQLKPEAALLKLRKSLGLYTNVRPAKIYNALVDGSSLKKEIIEGTDFVVLRELTGGIYFGEPRGYALKKGWNTMEYSLPEVERITRQAFEMAALRNKKVTSVDKANVLECSQFWRHTVHEIHKDYPGITLQDMYVDNAAMQIVRNPKQFDVILTSNLFGDILSDIAGMITGSLGMLPSASLGDKYALYEPVHGSAPDISGQNKANPIAMIDSVAMMFHYTFRNSEAAAMIQKSIENTLHQGFRTADICLNGTQPLSTTEMTEKILENL